MQEIVFSLKINKQKTVPAERLLLLAVVSSGVDDSVLSLDKETKFIEPKKRTSFRWVFDTSYYFKSIRYYCTLLHLEAQTIRNAIASKVLESLKEEGMPLSSGIFNILLRSKIYPEILNEIVSIQEINIKNREEELERIANSYCRFCIPLNEEKA